MPAGLQGNLQANGGCFSDLVIFATPATWPQQSRMGDSVRNFPSIVSFRACVCVPDFIILSLRLSAASRWVGSAINGVPQWPGGLSFLRNQIRFSGSRKHFNNLTADRNLTSDRQLEPIFWDTRYEANSTEHRSMACRVAPNGNDGSGLRLRRRQHTSGKRGRSNGHHHRR